MCDGAALIKDHPGAHPGGVEEVDGQLGSGSGGFLAVAEEKVHVLARDEARRCQLVGCLQDAGQVTLVIEGSAAMDPAICNDTGKGRMIPLFFAFNRDHVLVGHQHHGFGCGHSPPVPQLPGDSHRVLFDGVRDVRVELTQQVGVPGKFGAILGVAIGLRNGSAPDQTGQLGGGLCGGILHSGTGMWAR